MSKDEKKKKPGFMKRLFSSKKMSLEEPTPQKDTKSEKKLQRMQTVDTGCLSHAAEQSKKEEKPTSKDDSAARSSSQASRPKANGTVDKPRKPKKDCSGGKARRKKKDKNKEISVSVGDDIKFPCTPEFVLAFHKKKPFLNPSEEWLMVELNEYECLLDSMKIVKIIGKHSKFFEVEPDELWEEFFEYVEDVPAYDEVINYDIWQEFRDKKYPM